jgi:hypothetical protein
MVTIAEKSAHKATQAELFVGPTRIVSAPPRKKARPHPLPVGSQLAGDRTRGSSPASPKSTASLPASTLA